MEIFQGLLASGLLAAGMADVVHAAPKKNGLTVDAVMHLQEMTLNELVTQAKPRDGSRAALVTFPAASRVGHTRHAGIDLGKVLGGDVVAFGDLIEAARPGGSGSLPRRAVAPAVEVAAQPAVAKTTVTREPVTVTVTIGAEPDAEPVAKVTTPAEQVAATLAAQATAAKEAPPVFVDVRQELRLEITNSSTGLTFKPEALVFPKATASAKIVLSGGGLEGLAVFVRDQSVVSFDQKTMKLEAQQRGITEVYAVVGGKMYIVPVTVDDAAGEWDLTVPDALVSLDGIFRSGRAAGSALYPGLEAAASARAGSVNASGGASGGVSLAESLAETARTAHEVADQEAKYSLGQVELAYKAATIQVIDERSAPRAGRIYPVANAVVRLVGTEFAARTDATGHLTIPDMPTDSRFLLRIDDEGGIVRSGIAEISTGAETAGRVTRVRVVRNFSFDAYTNIAGVAQHAAYASYCATIVDPENDYAPIEGIAVGVDAAAEGPFYFNRYGFLDRALHLTGPDGRFCYYNVLPGPLAVSVYEGGAYVATFPASTFPGRHLDEELVLGGAETLTARLAAMGTAHEQLAGDVRVANSYKTIDMIDLIPLGTDTSMAQLAPGRVQSPEALIPHNGRVHAFAQAAEFEPTIYSFALDKAARRDGIVPLVPRGFVEDMSVYAQVAYNPEQGVVVTEYGHPADVETVSLKLVDHAGRDVGDGWYFSDRPITKAVFFNVPAGIYVLLAETSDGFWLAADTVVVYNETVSYARMGAPVRYRP